MSSIIISDLKTEANNIDLLTLDRAKSLSGGWGGFSPTGAVFGVVGGGMGATGGLTGYVAGQTFTNFHQNGLDLTKWSYSAQDLGSSVTQGAITGAGIGYAFGNAVENLLTGSF